MSNTINYASAYVNMLDRIYKQGAVTSILEPNPESFKFSSRSEKTVYIKRITTSGLSNYNRASGYTDGDINVYWDDYTFTKDRGKRFILDVQDEKEAMTGLAEAGAEFQRNEVNPEIDAYRFHQLCDLAGNNATPASLTYDTVIAEMRDGIKALDDDEVPKENRILFISSEVEQAMEDSGEFFKTIDVSKNNGVIDTGIKVFNGMPVYTVPTARFKDIFTFTTGFAPHGDAVDLNFVIVYKPAVLALVKYKTSNIINALANQTADGYIMKYRIYHDLFVPTNKVNGIYVHKKAS